MWPDPITLRGQHVTPAPLSFDHAYDLAEAAQGLQGLWYTMIPTPEGVPEEIEKRLAMQRSGTMLPFALLIPDGPAVRANLEWQLAKPRP